MGSFLMSCALTKQTIQEGEEVYIVPLISNTDTMTKSPVYPVCLFKPYGSLFVGTMEDYGRADINMSDCNNKKHMEMFLDFLKSSSCNNTSKYSKLIKNILEKYSHDDFWEIMHIMDKNLVSKQVIKFTVKFAFFIKKHVDTLFDIQNQSLQNSDCGELQKRLSMLSVEDRCLHTYNGLLEQYNSYSEGGKLSFKYSFSEIEEYKIFAFSYYGYSCLKSSLADIRDSIIESDKDKFMHIALHSHLLQKLTLSMMDCNMLFMPSKYACQDYGNVFGKNYAKLISIVSLSDQ